jgi:glycosyltransferase involved in cell wall biosynthesis
MSLTVLSVSYTLAQVAAGTAGGAEQVLATLDAALVRAGHKSLVLAPAGSRTLGLLIPVAVPGNILNDAAKQEARRTFKASLSHTLDTYPVDLVHMHGLDFNEYLPDRDIPIIITLHLPLSWYAQDALRFNCSIGLVCVSNSQAATAPRDVEIAKVISNGIDLEQFRSARKKSDYALVISRICPEKGIHLAIDAAEQAGIELIIAGSVFEYPEHRNYFESTVRPRLNTRVRFIGPVGGDRKADLLAGAHCLLIPSLAPETSSLVAMEAMASGTPVIAFRNGALPEIVSERHTGFLVGNAEEMACMISRAASISPRDCRDEAAKRFSASRMFDQYLELYQSVLNRNRTHELVAA